MEFMGSAFLDWDGTTTIPTLTGKSIKECLVNRLIVSYSDCRSKQYLSKLGSDHTRHLDRKFLRFGPPAATSTAAHFALLPSSFPFFLVTLYVKILCNSVNTDGDRRQKFDPDGSTHPHKSPSNPTPCYLCNLGSTAAAGDSIIHLFTHWQVVKSALALTLAHPRGFADPLLTLSLT